MGIWTTNAGNNYKVNIGQEQICKMKAAGARFCRFEDNPGINDENNEIYFETKTINGIDRQAKEKRVIRENITVTCEDGDRITGYITHLVEGYQCMGTHIGDWFIIKPSIHPESNQEELIVEDL